MDNFGIYDYLFDRCPKESFIYFGGIPYEQPMHKIQVGDILSRSKEFMKIYNETLENDPDYFNQVCQTGSTQWPTVINSVGITHLWVDFDLNESKPGKNYPRRQDVLDLMDVFRPNILVDSGHGFHGYFKLSKIYRAREIVHLDLVDIVKDFQEWLSAVLGGKKVDDISRLSRILRVPGSRNIDEEVKILKAETDFEYDLEKVMSVVRNKDANGKVIVDKTHEEYFEIMKA